MKKVGIAGIGGIGSNVALHLVRSGVKCFKIVDFDDIIDTNLNRQFYFKDQLGQRKADKLEENLKRINSELIIEKEIKLLIPENICETFADCDIIIEGFDKADSKAFLIDKLCKSGKIVISACGVAGMDADTIKIKKVSDSVFIVGDFKTDIRDKKLFSHKVSVAASLMAGIALKEMGFTDEK
jgi:sulfur carrier protein ThiS adenylyltransferase